jgi:hypothetical protein
VEAKSGVVPEQAPALASGRGRERARWVVGTLVAAAVPMFCYLRIAGDTQVNSDGAGLVWQAWAMLRWVPVAAAVLLGWSIIGDPLIEVVGVVPIFAACALRACWVIRSRQLSGPGPTESAAPRRPWSGWSAAWYELSIAAAAAAAVPLAMAGNRLIRHLGGYNVARPVYSLQPLHEIVKGLPVVWESLVKPG